jgi:hypothetical protein
MAKACSICQHPNARGVVNKMLEQKVSMSKISEATGFSKSAIGRHALRCTLREKAASLRSTRFNPNTDRTIVHHIDPKHPDAKPVLPKDFNPQTDWLINVSFEPVPASVLAVVERNKAKVPATEKVEEPKNDSEV